MGLLEVDILALSVLSAVRWWTGQEEISDPPGWARVYGWTLGVRLLQKQVMELAILAAAYAADIFRQIEGFASYGVPKSHAASFALLTYASCWLKCHEPAAFAAALINAYPIGCSSPAQILQGARRHRWHTLPVDMPCSNWDCRLAPVADSDQPAIRMGLCMVHGLAEKDVRAVEQARRQRPLRADTDLCLRAGPDAKARECLADAGALKELGGHRFQARWAMAALEQQLPLFAEGTVSEEEIQERVPPQWVMTSTRTAPRELLP